MTSAFAPIVLDARNPGPMTGAGNNTYLVVSAGRAVLVDAGVGHPEHLAALARAIVDARASLRTVVVTHDHTDHASGAPAVARAHPSAKFGRYSRSHDHSEPGFEWQPLQDGDRVEAGDAVLTVVHTPGHSPDHIVLWHEPSASVFSGDLVIPGRSVMIDVGRGGRLSDYLASLDRVLELEPHQLFPAHGPLVTDPRAVITAHIAHRLEREQQVLDALTAGFRTVNAIAESIYDGLDPRLMPAARENVRAHLEKLKADGIAADDDEGWTL
jgi:glyoxylase-like metal-dependent hydrolase (beta-lactamase superfamily II)